MASTFTAVYCGCPCGVPLPATTGESAAVAPDVVCVRQTTSLVLEHSYLVHRRTPKVVLQVVGESGEAHAEDTDNNVWPVSGRLPLEELGNNLRPMRAACGSDE